MTTTRTSPQRYLSRYVDGFGNISVTVDIGAETTRQPRSTGANHRPEVVARFLRELADDVERCAR